MDPPSRGCQGGAWKTRGLQSRMNSRLPVPCHLPQQRRPPRLFRRNAGAALCSPNGHLPALRLRRQTATQAGVARLAGRAGVADTAGVPAGRTVAVFYPAVDCHYRCGTAVRAHGLPAMRPALAKDSIRRIERIKAVAAYHPGNGEGGVTGIVTAVAGRTASGLLLGG